MDRECLGGKHLPIKTGCPEGSDCKDDVLSKDLKETESQLWRFPEESVLDRNKAGAKTKPLVTITC